jgi:hypothetical protein
MKMSMIQSLSGKHQKGSAIFMFTLFFNTMILPVHALGTGKFLFSSPCYDYTPKQKQNNKKTITSLTHSKIKSEQADAVLKTESPLRTEENIHGTNEPLIGGPSQPEMTAFKSVGTDNMVNLFTGDFSYNIPLMDVGGYPVNIFYDGGITMEQDASWVGLGWNINPGNINRNMRGIPDDFNGEDTLKQRQTMKPNITWGVNLGADLELVGIKGNPFSGSVGATLGVSFNNYLGPALDAGIRGSTHVSIGSKSLAEKSALTLGGSLSINASSRNGVTFSPGVSLTANHFNSNQGLSNGFGLKAGTSYNSRVGIRSIQLSEQMSFNMAGAKSVGQEYEEKVLNRIGNLSTTINFNKPSYVPSLRMPVTNTAFSGGRRCVWCCSGWGNRSV